MRLGKLLRENRENHALDPQQVHSSIGAAMVGTPRRGVRGRNLDGVGEKHIRPLGNLSDQSLAHWIRQDVIRLLSPAFV